MIKTQLSPFMYNKGKGELITRTEFLRWKYRNNEKDKINIRVGGGYLSIDEFLDQYTPVELEKLERKDPLKRFNEKIAVQKTLVGAAVRESSPIRGSPRKGSPTKI